MRHILRRHHQALLSEQQVLPFSGTAASTIGVLDQALNGTAALKAIPFMGSAISLNTEVDLAKTYQAAGACVKSGKYD